ncbi:MAG: hypothetical protein KBH06_14380 [Spirochaetes bacterium]|nr:hypothetical protein [Spirochaetota bacterium]
MSSKQIIGTFSISISKIIKKIQFFKLILADIALFPALSEKAIVITEM